jgi:hypothetical protein
LAKAGGFCPLHTWQYAETASDLGISIAYGHLAEHAAQLLRHAERTASSRQDLQDAVVRFAPRADRCPVCAAVPQAEREAMAGLVGGLRQEGEPHAPMLCVPHLVAAVAALPDLEHARRLVRRLADTFERAAEDLQMYALKRESLRRHLTSEDERHAALHVIAQFSGDRELARPWRDDDVL